MSLQPITVEFDLGDGRKVEIETGRLARQADGAVTVRMGDCILLATVVASKETKEGQDFFPLIVDYRESFAAAGRIPGSFFKREGKLSDYEVLISRLIDRALRPLFPDDYFCDVQVLVTLVSSDAEVMPDALAGLAASAALAVSDIPIQELISEVRVARVDGQFVINPSRSQLAAADMDFMVGATEKNILMVEGESKECLEEDLIQAIQLAHEAIKIQIAAQRQLREKAGAKPKRDYPKPHRNEALREKIVELAKDRISAIAHTNTTKQQRTEAFKQLQEEITQALGELPAEDQPLIGYYFHELQREIVRNMILDEGRRLDGRGLKDIRPLDMQVDVLPSTHGSAIFTRGETQSLTTVTLGTPEDELLIETAAISDYSKFILHYNFPPFSTGEVKMMRAPGRREIGHGNLALRSLKQMMPNGDYPYTVRVVSDILESNGSSSMATVCAGSLALMDAGVPLPKHVGGIAMGLISRPEDGKYAILTDILGDEDHLGDMDFKVAGTREGICGVQMDIKVDGLSMDVMREALEQARQARLFILDAMYRCIPQHREEPKPHAPRVVKMFIDREFIGAVIGPGGKIIQEIQRETGTTISIEEVGATGEVSIFSSDKHSLEKAVQWIKGIVAVPTVGETYEGEVKAVMPYGAFVEFLPGRQGLLHISEVSWKHLDSLEGVLKEGDKIKVKLTGADPKTGKFKLSRKALLPRPEGYHQPPVNAQSRQRGPRPHPRQSPSHPRHGRGNAAEQGE